MAILSFGAANVFVAGLLLAGCGNTRPPAAPAPASVPAGLQDFQFLGAVVDFVGRPLSGARVEVIDGSRAGTVVTTDESGRFSMPGTFTGNITLTVSKEGYARETRPLFPSGHTLPANPGGRFEFYFRLESLLPSPNVAGVYTLTLTADKACTDLPAEARTRTYTGTAIASARATVFGGTLSGDQFLPSPFCFAGGSCSYNHFGVSMVGDYAAVSVGVVERLGDSTYLAITTNSVGTFGLNGMAAPSSGVFLHCPGEPYLIDQGTWACRESGGVECGSYDQHHLALTRR
jgi:hypothetical protein